MTTRAHDIDRFLTRLHARLCGEIEAIPAARPAAPLVAAGGKGLRARLLWYAATAACEEDGQELPADLEQAAAAVELAHLGSLIHDDIVDGAETRRGAPALHRAKGFPTAIRTGSALLHLASSLTTILPAQLRQAVGHAIFTTCRGQVRELAGLFQLCSWRTRLEIVEDKTGAFFRLAVRLGAGLANASDDLARSLDEAARSFAVAFQTADDVADLVLAPTLLGRPNGADVRDGVMTLPIVLAAESSTLVREALGELRHAPSDHLLTACMGHILATNAIERANLETTRWRERSLAALEAVVAGNTLRDFTALVHHATPTIPQRLHSPRKLVQTGARTRVGTAILATAPTAPSPGRVLDTEIGRLLAHFDSRIPSMLERILGPQTAASHACGRPQAEDGMAMLGAGATALALLVGDVTRSGVEPEVAVTLADCLDAVAVHALTRAPAHDHHRIACHVIAALSLRGEHHGVPLAGDVNGIPSRRTRLTVASSVSS